MEIDVIGIPFKGDGTRPTQENPAAALREAGLVDLIRSQGNNVRDHGDLDIPAFDGYRDPETQVLNIHAWLKVSSNAAKRISAVHQTSRFLIVLGGDCSILLGIYGGLAPRHEWVGLMFLDAHTDYRDPGTSPTGEPADIELAVLTGRGPEKLVNLFGKQPLLKEDDVIIYGYREPDHISKSRIRCFSQTEMSKTGIKRSATQGLATLAETESLWLHFDVDVLDPTLMPVSFPEPNGLDLDQVETFFRVCLSSKRFIGLSVACYHPRLDPGRRAASRLVKLLASALSGANATSARKSVGE